MKAHFIKLDTLEETHDVTIVINTDNISTINRVNYNDITQKLITMIGE